jgi:hypothetical protein
MSCKICNYRNKRILERKRAQKRQRDAKVDAILDGKVIPLYYRCDFTGDHIRYDGITYG